MSPAVMGFRAGPRLENEEMSPTVPGIFQASPLASVQSVRVVQDATESTFEAIAG